MKSFFKIYPVPEKLKKKNKKLKSEAGFTLIELLIVIVVLGILMSMAVPALSGVKNKADLAVAKSDLHNVMHSLEMYYIDYGEYPGKSTEVDLSSVTELTDLNIKNSADSYYYITDLDDGAEEYLLYYKDQDDQYYYVSTDKASLIGPESGKPALESAAAGS